MYTEMPCAIICAAFLGAALYIVYFGREEANMKTVLGILGGIAAAVALGVGLSVAAPGLLENAQSGLPALQSSADASQAALGSERSAPTYYKVIMPISQVDFDDASTRIPVQVDGTTVAGETYSRLHFVDGVGAGIELPAGDYRMNIAGGYLTGEGALYLPPSDEVRAKIAADLSAGSVVQATIYIPKEQRQDNYVSDEIRERVESLTPSVIEMLAFTEVPLMEITEEQLDEVVAVAEKDTADKGRAEAARETVIKKQKEVRKAQEEAEREAAKAEERRQAEEQMNAARAQGQAVLDAARQQAAEAARQQAEEDKNAAKQINGWWAVGDGSGAIYYFKDGGYTIYQEGSSEALGAGGFTFTRLSDEQAVQLGSAGYLVSLGGPQCYVLLDSAPGVLQCRNVGDLSDASAGNLVPTVEPASSSDSSADGSASSQDAASADGQDFAATQVSSASSSAS